MLNRYHYKIRSQSDIIHYFPLQIAFYRLHQFIPSVYESCTTAIFKDARTETMRPVTTATRAFCEMMDRAERPSVEEFMKALQNCTKLHAKLAGEASMGTHSQEKVYFSSKFSKAL